MADGSLTTTIVKSGYIKDIPISSTRLMKEEELYKEIEDFWNNIVSAVDNKNLNHVYDAYESIKEKYKKYILKE